jgi:hypothetical protein
MAMLQKRITPETQMPGRNNPATRIALLAECRPALNFVEQEPK